MYMRRHALLAGGALALRYPNKTTMLLNLLAGQSFTIEMWVNVVFANPSQDYVGSQDAQYLMLQEGQFRVVLYPTNATFVNIPVNDQVAASMSLGGSGWRHLAFRYEQAVNGSSTGTGTIFLDGSPAGTDAIQPFPALDSVALGWVPSAAAYNNINGLLDETRVWGVARTNQQIADNYRRSNMSLPDLGSAYAAWGYNSPSPAVGDTYAGYPDGSGHGRTLTLFSNVVANSQAQSTISFLP